MKGFLRKHYSNRRADDMERHLRKAFEKNSVGKAVAEHIKKGFDKKHRVLLVNCTVGRNFAKLGEIVSKKQRRGLGGNTVI